MRHGFVSIEGSFVFLLALSLVSAANVPAHSQNAGVSSAPMLQGGVSRTGVAGSSGGSDVLVGAVIVTKNPHVHFTSHRDYISGRVYEPGPTPEECAQAVNAGLSIFNSVMGIVNSYGGYSSGGSSSSSSGSCSTPTYSSPPPTYSAPSCSGH